MTTTKLLTRAEIRNERGEVVWNGDEHGFDVLRIDSDAGERPISVMVPVPKHHPGWLPKLVGGVVDETIRMLAADG